MRSPIEIRLTHKISHPVNQRKHGRGDTKSSLPFPLYLSLAESLCLRHNSYTSNRPGTLFFPTPTGNEKYETFLNQARKNLEKEYNKYKMFHHAETTEEMPEDESFEVRLASLCTERVWQKDSMSKALGQGGHGISEK